MQDISTSNDHEARTVAGCNGIGSNGRVVPMQCSITTKRGVGVVRFPNPLASYCMKSVARIGVTQNITTSSNQAESAKRTTR